MQARRRLLAFIALGALPVFPSLAQPSRVWRLGILSIRARPISLDSDFQYGPFLKGLRELGYIEGKNLAIEWRFAHGNYELLPALAAELARLNVDVIAVVNVPVIRAAQQATKVIPIVMLSASNPVGNGFVSSLARPGGNITGVSNLIGDIGPKYVDLLASTIPKLSSVTVLVNPANAAHPLAFKNIQAAADRAGIKAILMETSSLQAIEHALAAMEKAQASAVIVMTDSLFDEWRSRIVELAVKYRMPSMLPARDWVEAGGLMSYGPDRADSYRRAATYVDRILKGAKPQDLPIDQPTKLELVINLKTAKALGLTIPPELLLRADEVIQ